MVIRVFWLSILSPELFFVCLFVCWAICNLFLTWLQSLMANSKKGLLQPSTVGFWYGHSRDHIQGDGTIFVEQKFGQAPVSVRDKGSFG